MLRALMDLSEASSKLQDELSARGAKLERLQEAVQHMTEGERRRSEAAPGEQTPIELEAALADMRSSVTAVV